MSVNFVTVGGNRPYGLQARWCVESIKYHYPDEGIFVAIPESETQSHQLPEGINTIQISQPVSDYNPSLKPAAIAEVERISDSNITIFVDPDVILLERLTLPDGELKAKPVNLNALWPKDKEKKWLNAYDCVGLSPPNYRTISTVDQSEIWPYFSAAVVVTEGVQIGQDWIDHERTLFDHGFDDTYLLGQVALAILASELQVSELTEQQNYPLAHRFYTKRDTELVHYQESRYLLKTWGRRDELRSIGIWSEITDDWDFDSRWLRTIWDWKQCLRDQFYWRTGGSGVRDRDNYDIEF